MPAVRDFSLYQVYLNLTLKQARRISDGLGAAGDRLINSGKLPRLSLPLGILCKSTASTMIREDEVGAGVFGSFGALVPAVFFGLYALTHGAGVLGVIGAALAAGTVGCFAGFYGAGVVVGGLGGLLYGLPKAIVNAFNPLPAASPSPPPLPEPAVTNDSVLESLASLSPEERQQKILDIEKRFPDDFAAATKRTEAEIAAAVASVRPPNYGQLTIKKTGAA